MSVARDIAFILRFIVFDDDFPNHHVLRLWTTVPIGLAIGLAIGFILVHFA